MRQNQTINPFPQSRQIGKGGGILNTLYEIGYWNKNNLPKEETIKNKTQSSLMAASPFGGNQFHPDIIT